MSKRAARPTEWEDTIGLSNDERGRISSEQTRLFSSPPDKNLDEIQFDLSMESEAMRRRGLEQLEKALDLIPDEDKVDFVEANHRVPHLVETESDPIRFLRREDFDAWAAASRLVTYWKMRKIIFGDRAFLPLNLSGTGALLPEDVAALETGYIVPLPNDCEGRPVLFYDDTRLGNQDKKQDLCNFFYLLSVVAENPLCQTEGYSVVALMSKVGFPRLNSRQAASKIVDLFEFAMPVRLCTIYLLRKSGNKGFLQTLLPHLFKQFGSYTTTRFTPVFTNSEEETLKKLKTYGLSESGLPQSIGGTWKYETFDQWLIQRRKMDREWSEGSLPGPANHSSLQPPSAKTVTTRPVSVETVESEEVIQNALWHFQDALQLIPHEEKTDYLEALERAPSLVQAESDPIRFLRREDFDAWAAARRLTNYWRHRKALFGERAFLPMIQTGKGALTEVDVAALETRYSALLTHDDSGHPILWLDRSRLPGTLAIEARIRALFYMLQVISEKEVSQRDGFIVFYLVSQATLASPLSPEAFRICREIVSKAMPLRCKATHILCLPPESNRTFFLETAIPITLRLLGPPAAFQLSIADSKIEMRQKLEALGFDSGKLPNSLGGSWSCDNAAKWQEERTKYECQVHNESECGDEAQASSLNATPSMERRRPAASSSCDTWLSNAAKKFGSVEDQDLNEESAFGVNIAEPSRAAEKMAQQVRQNRRLTGAGGVLSEPKELNGSAKLADTLDILPDRVEDEEMTNNRFGFAQLEEALDQIPDDDKVDYIEAKDHVPYLVATESDPSRFLRCTDFDPWAAARRLVSYWQQRRAIFGERAFLPMDQSGYGALSEEELRYLNSGYVIELPKGQEGETVVCFDRSLEPSNDNAALAGECRLRCLFYMMQVASENERSQDAGFVLIARAKYNFDRSKVKEGGELLAHVMPVRVKVFHILFCIPKAGEESVFAMLFSRTIQLYTRFFAEENYRIHVAESELQLFEHLREFGFTEERVPTRFGGTWKYEKREEWRQQRQEIERFRQTRFIQCHVQERKLKPEESASHDASRKHSLVAEDPLLAGEFTEAESTEKQALSELEEAIRLIPKNDKGALLEARRLVPALVKKESCPVRFILAEDYNAWAAASRLSTYWKMRKEIFGERAFLPMAQTGEGTLDRGDINVLNNGHLLVLPNDSSGRNVLCFDSSRVSDTAEDPAVTVRLAFYLGCIAAENEESQRGGYVVVCILGDRTIDRSIVEWLGRIHKSLPVRIRTVHVVHAHAPLDFGDETVLDPLILPSLHGTLQRRMIIHRQGSKEELLNDLQKNGLSKEGLPKAIGGDWSYEMFAQWQDLRTRLEWDLPTRLKHEKVGKMFRFSAKTLSELSEEDKVERKRRLNVLHSRRLRERQRIEVEVLREQVSEMHEKNRMLSKKNELYEQLLETARTKITATAGRHDIQGALPPGPGTERLPGFDETAPSRLNSHLRSNAQSSLENTGVINQQSLLVRKLLGQCMGQVAQSRTFFRQSQERETLERSIRNQLAERIQHQQRGPEPYAARYESGRERSSAGPHHPAQWTSASLYEASFGNPAFSLTNHPSQLQQNPSNIIQAHEQQQNTQSIQQYLWRRLPGSEWLVGSSSAAPREEDTREP